MWIGSAWPPWRLEKPLKSLTWTSSTRSALGFLGDDVFGSFLRLCSTTRTQESQAQVFLVLLGRLSYKVAICGGPKRCSQGPRRQIRRISLFVLVAHEESLV